MSESNKYNREETWGDLYRKHNEDKTGQNDFRSFAEQFEERGMKGFNKAEKGDHRYQGEALERKKERYPDNPQENLDLHGLTVEEAKRELIKFISEVRQIGLMFVLVVPGKGQNSPDGKAKLRPMVVQELERLVSDRLVADFRSAEPRHGGFGALYVYLK